MRSRPDRAPHPDWPETKQPAAASRPAAAHLPSPGVASPLLAEQFQGCLLGLALGDALGAKSEGGAAERMAWRMLGRTRTGRLRWTDDTQMTLDLAESLLAHGTLDPDDLARRFAQSYRWSRGYGPATARSLKRIARGMDWREANRSVHREGSFGNGGAMRAPAVGLFFAVRRRELRRAARLSASVTHAHPIASEGATLIASATAAALIEGWRPRFVLDEAARCCRLEAFLSRLETARRWIDAGEAVSAPEVAEQLGNGVAANQSCVTAVYLAARFMGRPFEELMEFVAEVGGDVDTIGAMGGAIWGAANGAARLPGELVENLEKSEKLSALGQRMHTAACAGAERVASQLRR